MGETTKDSTGEFAEFLNHQLRLQMAAVALRLILVERSMPESTLRFRPWGGAMILMRCRMKWNHRGGWRNSFWNMISYFRWQKLPSKHVFHIFTFTKDFFVWKLATIAAAKMAPWVVQRIPGQYGLNSATSYMVKILWSWEWWLFLIWK